MNAIKVSVILPIYNVEKYLKEAIQSVINQTLNEIEIILVNDGSTDNSDKICKDFTEIDERIIYLEQVNSGVSIARNKGFEAALGEYIFFMDSDDTLDIDFLKSSYDVASKGKYDIVVVGEYFCKRINLYKILPTWALLIKSEFLKKHSDIRYPEHIQPAEDGIFSHQIFGLTNHYGLNPLGIYNYRKHDNQNHKAIHRDYWKVLHQIPIWFQILDNFYSKHQLYTSHAFHLVQFIEIEPFKSRYLDVNLDNSQKEFLHNKIVEFYKTILPYLQKHEIKKLDVKFLHFVRTDFKKFDSYYKKLLLLKKIKLFFVKIIPISKYRRKLRIKLQNEF